MFGIFALITIIVLIIAIVLYFILNNVILPQRIATLNNLLRQGKYQTLIRIAKNMVQRDNRNVEAHYYLAKGFIGENRHELALMELKTIDQIGLFGGECPEVEYRKTAAQLYSRFSQPEEALKEYLLLIKLEPHEADNYYWAGRMFEERSKNDKAVGFYRKAVEIRANHSDAHYRLGYILYRNKSTIEAKQEFEAAVKYNPNNYDAFFYLGKLLKENHDNVAALVSFEKAQKKPELKVKALVERGGCYLASNNYDKAISELERAIKLAEDEAAPEVLYGRYFLATAYEKGRQIEKALTQYEEIYKKKPNFRDVAEKLSNYQDLRQDDFMKDYLTATREEYYGICQTLTMGMKLSVRDVADVPNGCEVLGVESDQKWRNARKMPKLIWYLRVPEMVTEGTVRSLHDKMKKMNVDRGTIVSSSNFGRKAIEYAETRPIDLFDKEKLQKMLQEYMK
jgi:tetratricopeptide (TPR) repeat protein